MTTAHKEPRLKLSETQERFVAKLREHGTLQYWRGGFWTAVGAPFTLRTDGGGPYKVPEWSFSSHTMKALRAKGVILVTVTTPWGPSEVKLAEEYR
jgi:hypothetical protein